MGPIIAIIGRPNVGKSSLFNKIIGVDQAIVADFSGLTRDRLYGNFKFNSKDFSVIDTGGISNEKDEINQLIYKEINNAIEEADGFIFLLDAHYGLTKGDFDIHESLRKSGKKYILALNKSELKASEKNFDDFYQLGVKNFVKISAKNGLGIKDLKEQIFEIFKSDKYLNNEESSDLSSLKICI